MEHLAVATGASSGIGFELAKYAAHKDYDLVIAADEVEIEKATTALRDEGAEVTSVQADLATREGVDKPLRSDPRLWPSGRCAPRQCRPGAREWLS
jgi:uncharacterized protein